MRKRGAKQRGVSGPASQAYGHIRHDDPRWHSRNTIEIFPNSWDDFYVGVGSTPWQGDVGSIGVQVLPDPSVDAHHRQLSRQVAVPVPEGRGIRIIGIRQMVKIGVTLLSKPKDPDDACVTLFERSVVGDWHFADGCVSWFVVRTQTEFSPALYGAVLDLPGRYPGLVGIPTGLLFNPPNAGSPYQPPNDGIPPGDPIGDLGVIRTIISPWLNPVCCLDTYVYGPALVQCFVSVKQTDPKTRCIAPNISCTQYASLVPEDQFVISFPDARYTRVAMSLMFETIPYIAGHAPKGHAEV